MKQKFKYCLLLFLFLVFQGAMAQNKTVTGTVTDESGTPLPGVNVVEKGTSNGTSTDFDGNYTISVADNATLVFSSLGYATTELSVIGTTTANISLADDAESLDEVVVTALGIERDRRSLGYAVTQLGGESVAEVKTTNALNALQGKVAGVNITPPATGAAGSSRVVIRGASSLAGGNQPLYVVDGVTIDNTQLGAASEWGGSDFGDGVSSINPDDVESVSVLKGGAAAALYGSRAAAGVIIITTKNGKEQEGFGIDYSSQVTFDNIQSGVRDFQREYGQGSQGIAPTTAQEALDNAFRSWGPRLGSTANSVQYDGVSRPYTDAGDNLDRFYRTGTTFINTVALSKAGENFNYRFGVTNLDNEDVVPNSNFNRKSFSLNLGAIHNEKLSLNLSARYIVEKVNNRPRISDTPGNPNFAPAVLPANVNVEDLGANRNGALEDGTEDQISSNPFVQNPYWAASRFTTFDRKNRILSSATLKYDILDWLNITARAGIDHQVVRSTRVTGFGTAFSPLGDINEFSTNLTQVDADIILGIDKAINNDFKVEAFFGANKNTQRSDALTLSGSRFVIPFLEILGNVENASRSRRLEELALSALYGQVEFSYKDYLYLTVTGRNEWFSTLSAADKDTPNNEFYGSASASFVFSELLENSDWLSFGRLRVGYSEVGGGAPDPYSLSLPFSIFGQGHLGQPLGRIDGGTVPNATLTPFVKTETEVGLDLSFLDNRLGLDIAYYTNTTDRDILNVNISNTSGFGNVASNIGVLKNKGIEALLKGVPIRNQNFGWNTSLNLTFNESFVESTDDTGGDLNVGNVRTFAANIIQRPGERFGKIVGTAFLRNNGQIVYDAAGLPVINPERQVLGDGVPPWTVGWNNSFNYKNFNLSFLIDGKFGGQVYSGTNSIAYGNGLHRNTLEGREGGLTVTGVDEAGNPFTFTHDNTTLQSYYGRLGSIAEEVTYDSDFIKLRQLSFGYTLPSSILENTFIQSASISFVGRDLFFISRATDNINPESAFNTSNAQGLEYFGLPPIGSYGLTLNVKF
ncbi:SusC/RagA family TonB-linked outer membrane protein [uncultured Croceitalea sp.]|uniref:SusC/RagA family TonB-linked outer membrane protein n=1 Tax=uncultured Croceitalea sp. TaxID=1798908 RepID=UPI003305DFB0